jgi:hypothetical protein
LAIPCSGTSDSAQSTGVAGPTTPLPARIDGRKAAPGGHKSRRSTQLGLYLDRCAPPSITRGDFEHPYAILVSHMASATTSRALAATRQWLKPAVHVLLRCGVTWRDFSELAKSVYVEVATAQFGKRGRPTNVSRTAVLTGLARRDVRKQRANLDTAEPALTGYVTKASLVLSAWHLDPEFLDKKGKPALLPVEGEGPTFAGLLRKCEAGDVPPSTLRKELVSAGAVRQRADGRLEALERNYIPHSMDEELILLWGPVLADVATTYVHNLTRTAKTAARFERVAVNDRIAEAALPEFRKFLDQEGQAFLERVDAWLTAHQLAETARGAATRTLRLGAGVYHVQD